MKSLLTIFILTLSFCCRGQTSIKGIVYDKKGPLPAVVVVEEGSGNMVMTNAKGEFHINTESDKPELNFSYIGYLTDKVKKGKVWKVKMKLEKTKKKHVSSSNQNASIIDRLKSVSLTSLFQS